MLSGESMIICLKNPRRFNSKVTEQFQLVLVIVYFRSSMKTGIFKYQLSQKLSSVFMMLALVWLTVSIPYVYAAKQQAGVTASKAATQATDEDDSNPFSNTTEEKAPSSTVNTISEEYIHHSDELFHAAELSLSHHRVHSATEYVAFHGELLCPPPNLS
jgi:hypothetical protein